MIVKAMFAGGPIIAAQAGGELESRRYRLDRRYRQNRAGPSGVDKRTRARHARARREQKSSNRCFEPSTPTRASTVYPGTRF
jgi:hypothetical protein